MNFVEDVEDAAGRSYDRSINRFRRSPRRRLQFHDNI